MALPKPPRDLTTFEGRKWLEQIINQIQVAAATNISIGDALGGGTAGSVLFVDASGNLAQDNSDLYYDATNDALGINTGTSLSGTLEVGGAINARQETNAFGTSSTYTTLVFGDITGSTANNGGLYACARYNKTNEPFTALSAQDDGNVRVLYFGGGGWGVPDATRLDFYTADAYNETNDAGVLRFTVSTAHTHFNSQQNDHDFIVSSPSETRMFLVDMSTDSIGVKTDTPLGAFDVRGAGHFQQEASPFGSASANACLVLGAVTGTTGTNNAVVLMGRNNKSNAPFTGFWGSDTTAQRILYFGGGGADAPDATLLNFYAAGYDELTNQATLKAQIGSTRFDVNPSSLDFDFRVYGQTDSNLIRTDASADLVGIGDDRSTVTSGKLLVAGALCVEQEANAFGATSPWTLMVLGSVQGATTSNGGPVCGGRRNKTHEPFTVIAPWDDGSVRDVRIGGGGFGIPDATAIEMYTASAYNETSNAGVMRVNISGAGMYINDSQDDYDFRVRGDTDASLFFVNAGDDCIGIGDDRSTTTDGKLLVAGALNLEFEANAFGATSPWTIAVLGAVSGSTTANGGVVCGGRNNKSYEPFTCIVPWDNGSARTVYIGGGGFGIPDATAFQISLASTYNETSNAGVSRLLMNSSGTYFNDAAGDYDFRIRTDNDNTAFYCDGGTDQVSVGCDPGSAVGKLGVKQPSATGAKPTLYLEQKDVDEELIYVRAASHASTAANTLVDAGALTTPGSIQGWMQVYIRDDNTNITDGIYYVPFYSAPTA